MFLMFLKFPKNPCYLKIQKIQSYLMFLRFQKNQCYPKNLKILQHLFDQTNLLIRRNLMFPRNH
jgi:hypothetical protein